MAYPLRLDQAEGIMASDSSESPKSNLQGNQPPKRQFWKNRLLKIARISSPFNRLRILHRRLVGASLFGATALPLAAAYVVTEAIGLERGILSADDKWDNETATRLFATNAIRAPS
jgi:hypothetical protein